MKAFVQKYIQAGAVIAISCIAIFGTVCAQEICCIAISNTCALSSNQIPVQFDTFQAHRFSIEKHELISSGCVRKMGGLCCRLDGCDGLISDTYIHSTHSFNFYTLPKILISWDMDWDEKNPCRFSITGSPLKVLPIYLFTQSILC